MADKCGAKKSTRNGRAGGKCGNPGMENGRCRFHGGLSTGPKEYNAGKNALKHGVYSKYFDEEDRAMLLARKIGTLESEIAVAAVRVLRLQRLVKEKQNELETVEVIERDVPKSADPDGTVIAYYAPREEKKAVVDYSRELDRWLARLQSLELARIDLLNAAQGEEDDDTPIRKLIIEVVAGKPRPGVVNANNSHDHDSAAG